jgi:hypothetical protein
MITTKWIISKFLNERGRIALICIAAAATLAFLCVPAMAQVIYGTVVGNVTDQTGAVVPGANVKITSLTTGEIRSVLTGSAGTYSFPNLPAGTYRVEVQQPGFKQFVQNNVVVQVDVTSRVDIALQIGDISETVEVTGMAPLIQTDSSSLGSVISNAVVESLPLSGRNVNNMLTLVAGVVAQGGTYGNAASNQAAGARTNAIGFGNYAIGGGFGNQSSFYLDGVSTNGPANNLTSYIPSQDTVQEFKVVTNNVSAEYGNYAGGVINITTKSGTNDFHGSAYEYLRNKVLNANDYFNNKNGLPRAPLVQNQFGGTLGGPIKKDKTFFFFGAERQVIRSNQRIQSTIPTAAMLSGNFSAAGLPNIYDQTQPGNPQFQCNGQLNVICPNRLDQAALAIIRQEYPAANLPGLVNNWIGVQKIGGVNNQINARVDHRISNSNEFFIRYGYWKAGSNPYDAWGTLVTGQGATGLITHQGVIGDTATLNTTTILDLRLSYVYMFEHEYPDSEGVDLSKFGGQWGNVAGNLIASANWPALTFNASGAAPTQSGTNGIGSQLFWRQKVYTLSGNLSKVVGRHQFKFGGVIRRVRWVSAPENGGMSLTFDPVATMQANGVGGYSFASALLGIPQSTSNSIVGGSNVFFTAYGFFAEDTFQPTRKLTINLGLRWDQPSKYSEAKDSDTVFLADKASPLTSFFNPVTGKQQQLMGNPTVVNSPAWPSNREDYLHWKMFSPRLGFAYRLSDATVVRAGYGISYPPSTMGQDGPNISTVNSAITNYANTFQVQTGSPNSIQVTVADPYPQGFVQPVRHAATPDFFYGKNLSMKVPGDPVAYVQQWNVAVERQIGKSAALTVAYAGSKGSNLLLMGFFTVPSYNINQIADEYFSMGSDALLAQVPNPFYGIITTPGSILSAPTVAAGQLLRPFPQYLNINALSPYKGRSNYNSLQTSLQKRFASGGILTVAYTFSRLRTNTGSVTTFLDEGALTSGGISDNNHLDREYSLGGYDIPHNLAIGYTIDLPFGRGKKFLGNASGIAGGFLSGWRVNGITTFRSGNPIAIWQFRGNATLAQLGGGAGGHFAGPTFLRPDVVAGCNKSASGSRQYRADHGWFNTACFIPLAPTDMRFGNEPRIDEDLRADGMNNWDFSIAKKTSITEKLSMQFTAEFYNLFNHVRFSPPDNHVFSPLFGVVTSAANQPRAVQFGLRFDF